MRPHHDLLISLFLVALAVILFFSYKHRAEDNQMGRIARGFMAIFYYSGQMSKKAKAPIRQLRQLSWGIRVSLV